MHPIRLLVLFALMAAAIAAAAPSSAAAAGGPILVTAGDGERGITSADGEFNYAVLIGSETTVAKIATSTGEVDAWMNRSEGLGFGLPQVAADGNVAGLSADGGTLVLISQGGPINRAELLVLGTNKLRVRNEIELEGQYSFDAIAPDGRHAYVVEYPQPLQYDRYRVLKLDLKTGHLAKHPITDTDVGLDEEEEEAGGVEGEMRGLALSRVSSTDGRWAYTLYDGGGDVPFIHALDTVGDKAVCIFMPQLEGLERNQIAKASITTGPDPGTISVVGRENHESSELARVSTSDFAVTVPEAEVSESGSGLPVPLLVAIGLVALALGAFGLWGGRRGGDAGSGPEAEPPS
jgi:hypothetical protein